jgi:predicted nicotinamide N-methyase
MHVAKSGIRINHLAFKPAIFSGRFSNENTGLGAKTDFLLQSDVFFGRFERSLGMPWITRVVTRTTS